MSNIYQIKFKRTRTEVIDFATVTVSASDDAQARDRAIAQARTLSEHRWKEQRNEGDDARLIQSVDLLEENVE